MAALVGKRVRTTQPQPAIASNIDWGNPITRDMNVCLIPADQAYGIANYIDGAGLSQTLTNVPFGYGGAGGSGAQSNTVTGVGARPLVSSGFFDLTSKGAVNSPNYSLFAVATCTSTSATQSALDMDNSAGRYFQFRFAAGKVDLIPFNGSGSPTGQATAATALSLAEMSRGFSMGATISPSRTAVFQNGVITVGSAPSGMVTPTTALPVRVGARLTGSQVWSTGALMLVVIWARTLSDAEMQSLADNPWQLFKPQSRRMFMVSPSSSADGTAPIAGVSASSSVASVTASGDATTTVISNDASSAVASVTASGDALATLAALSAASPVGTIIASGAASTNLTGTIAATSVGNVSVSGGASAILSGVSAATAVGTINATAGGSATAGVSGVSAATSVGDVGASGDASVTLGAVSSNGKANDMTVTGGASSGPLTVSALFAVGTIIATGTSGSVTVNFAGVSTAAGVGTINATGTRTTIDVNVTEDMICKVVRSYVKSIAPALKVLRTPVNRASMPNGPYVSFTPGLRRPLSTNVSSNDANSRTVRRPEQMSFQIDCYGEGSAELAETLNMLYRDHYACEQFATSGLEIVPLYAGDIQQAPFVNDADQYEERYTFEIELQVNSSIIVPLQSCNILDIDLVSVDANFPPTEE